jgi:hypothetical protein
MESAPAAPFMVAQPEVLFQFLVVTLDAPALRDGTDQFHDGRVRWQRGQDVLARLGLVLRPFNDQPLQRAQSRLAGIAAG